MNLNTNHQKKPEEKELENKLLELTNLEAELAEQELNLVTLQGELKAFEIRYLRVVGVRYAELDKIELQIAELQLQMKPAGNGLRESAARARGKASESADAVDFQEESPLSKGFTPSEDLKKLYREVAKTVHPDLADGEKERSRREALMVEANKAYERGDEGRLEEILREWEISPESVKGEGVGSDLVRVIRKTAHIQDRLSAIEADITQLEESDLYRLKTRVEEAESRGGDLLAEMASRLDDQIALAKQRLKEMQFGYQNNRNRRSVRG